MYRKKALIGIIYLIFLVLLLEVWARGYYTIRRGVSFFSSPGDMVYMWYPELKELTGYNYEKDGLNVLLLGGSALTEEWGRIPEYISKKTGDVFGKKANIVNLARPAHSSLDSFYKYEWAGDKRFDLVVFYHGINEVRANNVPPELWKKDYAHYSWYDEVNFYFRHPVLRGTGLFLPYFIKHLLVQLDREVVHPNRFVPTHSPRLTEWVKYGKDIKTEESFRDNLLGIMRIAESKKEPLMAMTFAYYSVEEGESDNDSPYVKFTRVWGDPGNVVLGINVHNEVVRGLAGRDDLIFLDQQKIIGNDKRYFSDICHFSGEGSEVFVENMFNKLKSSGFEG